MKRLFSLWIFIALTCVFFVLGRLYKIQAVTNMDTNILLAISEIRTEFLTSIMLFLSYIGSWRVHIWIVGALVFYFIVKKRYSIVVLLIFNLYGSRLLNQFLKNIYMRERPSIRMMDVAEYSFPSGHAMNNMALFGFILFLILSSKVTTGIKRSATVFLVLLIAAISFSRMYLAVHYPTDILAGWCGGGMVLVACAYLYKKYHMKI